MKKGKNEYDKFYTKTSISSLFTKYIPEYITINEKDICIEPSAGNGSFIQPIKSLFQHYVFLDILPEHHEIIKMDFLTYNHETKDDSQIHIIGNPPFGRQSSNAIKFIKYAASFAESISFILPKSFKKESMHKYFPLHFHILFEKDLPKNSFLMDEKEIDVPCVFQIWKKEKHKRIIPEKLKPNGFTFIHKNQNPTLSFRRVGVNAGFIDMNIENKAIQSHYFILFDEKIEEDIIDELEKCIFVNKENTVGPKSISKQELIKEWNPIFQKYLQK